MNKQNKNRVIYKEQTGDWQRREGDARMYGIGKGISEVKASSYKVNES